MSASFTLFMIDLVTKPELLAAYSDIDRRDRLFADDPTADPPTPAPPGKIRELFGADLTNTEIGLMQGGDFATLFEHLRDNPRPTTSGDRIGTGS